MFYFSLTLTGTYVIISTVREDEICPSRLTNVAGDDNSPQRAQGDLKIMVDEKSNTHESIVYKVVYAIDGLMLSVNSYFPYEINYVMGKPVRSPQSPIFAFDSFKNAQSFRNKLYIPTRILKCAAEESGLELRYMAKYQGEKAIATFWENIGRKNLPENIILAPPGTVYCNILTPLADVT